MAGRLRQKRRALSVRPGWMHFGLNVLTLLGVAFGMVILQITRLPGNMATGLWTAMASANRSNG